ncbi:MAG: hypothetical protein PVI33_01420 [Candidatus Omnitrophota bacterium]|jgi:hypothetical protein
MTFKKINKRACHTNKKNSYNQGQSIFEYFILTIVVVGVLFLTGGFAFRSQAFQSIKNSCENAFNQAMGEMLD